MQYLSLPGIFKKVSALVQGTVMLSSENEKENFALLDAVYEMGCTTFDTAHVYGNGDVERVLGRWIKANGIREQVVILDKGAHHNPDRKRVTPFDIASDIHDSLARLQTDYIDLYALHRDDPSSPVGPIMETLEDFRKAGKINVFGVSNWRAARIEAANNYATDAGLNPFAFSSPHFSLAAMVELRGAHWIAAGDAVDQSVVGHPYRFGNVRPDPILEQPDRGVGEHLVQPIRIDGLRDPVTEIAHRIEYALAG